MCALRLSTRRDSVPRSRHTLRCVRVLASSYVVFVCDHNQIQSGRGNGSCAHIAHRHSINVRDVRSLVYFLVIPGRQHHRHIGARARTAHFRRGTVPQRVAASGSAVRIGVGSVELLTFTRIHDTVEPSTIAIFAHRLLPRYIIKSRVDV